MLNMRRFILLDFGCNLRRCSTVGFATNADQSIGHRPNRHQRLCEFKQYRANEPLSGTCTYDTSYRRRSYIGVSAIHLLHVINSSEFSCDISNFQRHGFIDQSGKQFNCLHSEDTIPEHFSTKTNHSCE